MKFVATDFVVAITTMHATPTEYDLSDHVTSCELPIDVDAVDSTAFGDGGWKRRVAGLKDASVKLSLQNDFAVGSIDDILWPLLGESVTVAVRPRSSAVSATNPEYVVDALVTNFTPVKAGVGNLATFDVTWPADGAVERHTS
jgi:hypothetical protein